ncbi:MAG TPA: filamentous hemagglutinin N-terminal domain-containing protein, partial [Burkholderiales bacterium]|nr:filamentous hemagglutinin N-terminal domain-containing protein [Burkholderiales bacterium]
MKKDKRREIAAGTPLNQPLRRNAIAFAVATALSSPLYAQNLPTGLTTVSGSVTVTNPTATSMNLNQASQNANMNAQTFSIGQGYRVDVHQPNSSSVMMMNVVGNNPSSIFGTLTANGQFFLVNPSGVLFGPGSSVDVGGLVATTMPISFADATSGHYVFTANANSGSVVNQGTITALNGYVGLFAPNVINTGVIVARMGSVALAAGNQVTLDMVGDGLIKVAVNESALNAAVMNKGSIEADGGNVLLTARSANALLDTVINTDGVIRANTISNRNGVITLDGGTAGVVSV